MNELALFAGAGGGILGGKLLGWKTVCAVECDAYAASVLVARQNDGILEPFPIWDDVRTFDGKPWRGIVDVVSGGFPCTDISCAGKGAGIGGEASGLWREMARIIREVRPCFVFVENSPMLTSRGLGTVIGALAALGYDAKWGVVSAEDAGAPHKRERIWIVANADGGRRGQPKGGEVEFPRRAEVVGASLELAESPSQRCGEAGQLRPEQSEERLSGGREEVPDADEIGWYGRTGEGEDQSGRRQFTDIYQQVPNANKQHGNDGRHGASQICREQQSASRIFRNTWWDVEPGICRVANGVANRVDRLRALGNGQVPAVAALAWEILNDE